MTNNLFAILILLVLLYAVVTGFMKGLLAQIGQIAGVVIGILASRALTPSLLGVFGVGSQGSGSAITIVLCYIVVYLVAYFAVVLVARLIRLVVRVACLGVVDRICGAVFKMIKWALIISLVYNLIVACDLSPVPGDSQPVERFVYGVAPFVLGMCGR